MNKFTIPHEAWLSNQDVHLQDIISTLVQGFNNMQQQTNANAAGPNAAPPTAPSSFSVSPVNGVFHFRVFDNNPVNRGVHYFVEYSATPGFDSPFTIPLGPSRNDSRFLGNQTLYFRAFAQYPTSGPSDVVYFGSASSPTAVTGGGSVTGSLPLGSAGSGTADSNGTQGGQGFGFEPTRGPRLPE